MLSIDALSGGLSLLDNVPVGTIPFYSPGFIVFLFSFLEKKRVLIIIIIINMDKK